MRHNSKLKQSEVAKKCNIANTTLSGYESGYREPTFETIEKIANICGYDIFFINRKNKEIFGYERRSKDDGFEISSKRDKTRESAYTEI